MSLSSRGFLAVSILSAAGAACAPAARNFGSGGAGGEGGGASTATSTSSTSASSTSSASASSTSSGGCAAPMMDCGGTCIDPGSDPQNCGACGHDCLGGGCQGSMCQP